MGILTKHDYRQQGNVSSLFWVGVSKPCPNQAGISFWHDVWDPFRDDA